MNRFVFCFIDGVILLSSMLMGFFSAAGLCAFIWGPSILDSALGEHPNRTHPAFITFLIVMVPAMLIGACGALSGIILPLHLRFRIPFLKARGTKPRFIRDYASRIIEFTNHDEK